MMLSLLRTRFGIPAILAVAALVFAMALSTAAASAAPLGAFTGFSTGLNTGAHPLSVAPGPEGNLWFVDGGTTPAIGRITPTGAITEFSAGLHSGASPVSIAAGPDGNMWFTDDGTIKAIGRITPAGAITEFSAGLQASNKSAPLSIAAGPDGNLWFTDFGHFVGGGSMIGRITPTGTITEFFGGKGAGNLLGPAAGEGTTTENSKEITSVVTSSGSFAVGQTITGEDIPPGTTITACSPSCGPGATGLTLSANATATGTKTGQALTAGSDTVSSLAIAPGGEFTVGASIYGEGIPAGTTIAACSPSCGPGATGLTLSANATETKTGDALNAGLQAVSAPTAIAAGPDGDMWFTDRSVLYGGASSIGRITPAGTITEFSGGGLPTLSLPWGIAAGPDGNMWFTDLVGGYGFSSKIGRITPSGAITEFKEGLQENGEKSVTISIAAGPDGDMWFTDQGTAAPGKGVEMIGRISPGGTITEIAAPSGSKPAFSSTFPYQAIAPGSDGNMWFADEGTTPAIGQVGVDAPAASLDAPSVIGSLQEQTQQTCGGERWADWAGMQPFDGGLLASSTTPAVQWLLNGAPVAGPAGTASTYTPGAGSAGAKLACRATVTYRYPLGVTVSSASPEVTVIKQSQGAEGKEGKVGPAGANGAAGQTGPAGAKGAQGAAGPQGPAGAAGQIQLVTCKTVVVKKKKKQQCTTKLVSGTVKFTATGSAARASLARAGVVYATGTASERGVQLNARRTVRAGRYTLTLTYGHGQHTTTVRRQVRIG